MSLLFLPSSRLYPPFTPTTWTTPSLFLFLIFFSYLMVLLCFCLPLFYSIFCAPTFSYGPLSPFNHRICLGDLIWFDMNRTPYSETLTCSLTVKFVLSLIPIFYLPPCFLGLLFERNESAYCSCVSFFLYSLGRPSAKVPFFLLFFFQLLYPSSLFFPLHVSYVFSPNQLLSCLRWHLPHILRPEQPNWIMFASKFRVLLAHTPTLSIDDLSFPLSC